MLHSSVQPKGFPFMLNGSFRRKERTSYGLAQPVRPKCSISTVFFLYSCNNQCYNIRHANFNCLPFPLAFQGLTLGSSPLLARLTILLIGTDSSSSVVFFRTLATQATIIWWLNIMASLQISEIVKTFYETVIFVFIPLKILLLLTLVCTFIFTKQYAFQSINKRCFDFFSFN